MKQISKEILDILACPKCKGDLDYDENQLVCPKCDKRYEIKDGIPVFVG